MKLIHRRFIYAAAIAAFGVFLYFRFVPNFSHVNEFEGVQNPIVFRGNILSANAKLENGEILLPLEAIKESFDPFAFGEADGTLTLVGPSNNLLHFDSIYAPVSKLTSLYSLDISKNPTSGAVYIPDGSARIGDIATSATMRNKASIRGGIVSTLPKGEEVEILDIGKKWARVQSKTGFFGFVPAKNIHLYDFKQIPPTAEIEKPITLVWDQGGFTAASALTGITVVSPVWFSLIDSGGNIDSPKASSFYVSDAHSRNIKVWALFNNSFKPQMTHDALRSFTTRQIIISSIMSSVDALHLDGINIDFENVFLKDKTLYAQFVRELSAALHKEGKISTADVGVKSNNETWSMFFDRKAIGSFVDYLMLMAYDQTPEASKEAGSIASLPWTEEGVASLLKEVSASKVLLSIPLYTRVWTGEDEVTGKTLSYKFTSSWLLQHGFSPTEDSESGQHFVDGKDKITGKRTRVWIEDTYSMKKRFELSQKYGLAGIAAWSRNHANEDTWKTFLSFPLH